jgi:hypothetical protein
MGRIRRKKRLDFSAESRLDVHDGREEPGDVVIEHVRVKYSDDPPDPVACEALQRLLARLVVRAYLRKYGQGEEGAEEAVA